MKPQKINLLFRNLNLQQMEIQEKLPSEKILKILCVTCFNYCRLAESWFPIILILLPEIKPQTIDPSSNVQSYTGFFDNYVNFGMAICKLLCGTLLCMY